MSEAQLQVAADEFIYQIEKMNPDAMQQLVDAASSRGDGNVYSQDNPMPIQFPTQSTRSTAEKFISKRHSAVNFLGNKVDFETWAHVKYNPDITPRRYVDCVKAGTTAVGINYIGASISTSALSYYYSIIDSGRTLAVTTYTSITVKIGNVTSSGNYTEYTEFPHSAL